MPSLTSIRQVGQKGCAGMSGRSVVRWVSMHSAQKTWKHGSLRKLWPSVSADMQMGQGSAPLGALLKVGIRTSSSRVMGPCFRPLASR
mmetsp:Transcript_103026/g.261664  ORF Transcript_103026/g.261664 Transcript_103026/m.261664 type:complete len:88 (-) Transcript_103026:376-639(-)